MIDQQTETCEDLRALAKQCRAIADGARSRAKTYSVLGTVFIGASALLAGGAGVAAVSTTASDGLTAALAFASPVVTLLGTRAPGDKRRETQKAADYNDVAFRGDQAAKGAQEPAQRLALLMQLHARKYRLDRGDAAQPTENELAEV
jgi:hypothetical protein